MNQNLGVVPEYLTGSEFRASTLLQQEERPDSCAVRMIGLAHRQTADRKSQQGSRMNVFVPGSVLRSAAREMLGYEDCL